MKELLTTGEVMRMLNISKKQVYTLMEDGSLVAVDVAKRDAERARYRFTKESVLNFIKEREVPTKGK